MKLVHVTWVDSTYEEGWVKTSQIVKSLNSCESIGWLVRETDDFITIAGHISNIRGQESVFQGVITIPRRSIELMTEVTE